MRGPLLARLDRRVSQVAYARCTASTHLTVGDSKATRRGSTPRSAEAGRCRPLRHLGDGADRLSGARSAAAAGLYRSRRRGAARARGQPIRDAARARRHARPESRHARPAAVQLCRAAAGRTRRAPLSSSRCCRPTTSSTRTATSSPRRRCELIEIGGRRCAVSVCEDVWNDCDSGSRPRYHRDPIDDVRGSARR